MLQGTATHTFVFEPDKADTVLHTDARANSNAYKELLAEAEAAGGILLSTKEYDVARRSAEAVRANPDAAELLSGDLLVEQSIFAHDAIYNVDVRIRPDGWRKDIATLLDLKTTVDPSPEGFAKATSNFDDTIDTISKEVEEAIAADRTLGGLAKDTYLESTEIEFNAEGEKPLGYVSMTFLTNYYVKETNPDVAV